jgi:hypothetical protein
MADNDNLPSQTGENLTAMSFDEFRDRLVASGHHRPVWDQRKGFIVYGRDDLFDRHSDTPLWQALAKEHGIWISNPISEQGIWISDPISPEMKNLTSMHFSEFQKWQIESGRPQPVFDQEKGGWVVPGRDDLFAKRTDMPLWQTLAKEQGIGIYLKTPPTPGADVSTAEENTITNAQLKLDLNKSATPDPTVAPEDSPAPSLFQRLGALFTGKEQESTEHPWLHEPPESIAKRYLYTNGEYYFRDRENARAFSDEGERLKTPGNDPIVIASMVEVAKTKGWTSLHLKGTEEFMREAWYQAKLAGLDVTGFQPKPVDQARLAAAIGEPAPENTISQSTAPQLAQANVQPLPGMSPTGEHAQPVSNHEKSSKLNPLHGIVVAFGADAYQHDKREGVAQSFFIAIKALDGSITAHWGKDLERLANDAKLAVGDMVTLMRGGKKDVTVADPVHDADGKLVRYQDKVSQLNAWDVTIHERAKAAETPTVGTVPESTKQPTKEQSDRYNAFMNEPKQDVLAKYPEMGIYYELLKRKVREDLLLVTDPGVSADHHQKLKVTIGDMVRNGQALTPEMLPEIPPLPDSPSLALRAIAAEQAKIAEKQGAATEEINATVEDVLRYGGRLEAKGIALELPLVLRQNEPAGKTVELAPKTFRTFEEREQKLSRGR